MPNQRRDRSPFSSNEIQAVWNKATVIPGQDINEYRLDACGAVIQRSRYGDTSDKYNTGWEIDHIRPLSRGGGDEITNLQPLHWANNRSKGDEVGTNYCSVSATNRS